MAGSYIKIEKSQMNYKISNCFLTSVAAAMAVCILLIPTYAASPACLKAHDAEIKVLVTKMTLAEKAGQMTQPDIDAIKDYSDIEALFLGSLLSGGNSDPKTGNKLKDWAAYYESCQSRALKTRLAIPLLYGIDAVHGHNNVIDAVIFPHNIGLGCTRDAGLVERIAQVTAKEVRATGIQWTFAPCLTVPRDIRWGRAYEGFSEDPSVVAELGVAAVRGLQGKNLSDRQSVLSCAKHFIGDGGTTYENNKIDQGNTVVDEATLRAIHLAGYPAAIDAGVGTIMPSFSSWNNVKCSGNKFLLTDLLKKELGFDGFLISDWDALDQLKPDNYKQCIEMSINAGMDMVMVTNKYRDFIRQLQELVNEGRIPMARIDDAVTRILRVKFAMGMMAKDAPLMADAALQKEFGSDAHRAVAREAVRKSLVLLKNENKVLPLSRKAKRIHVAGSGADDLGMQCGGWTIDWQGRHGNVTTGGTTILAALRGAAGKDTEVTVSKGGADAKGADVVVVVVGEEPYAEMNGDRGDLALTAEDSAAVLDAKSAGVPVVVVMLSGRPVVLGEVASKADALVAAWLPGTEGQGVADVLFGDVAPTGKLSFTWPRSMAQLPLGHGKATIEDAQFHFGFGLGY